VYVGKKDEACGGGERKNHEINFCLNKMVFYICLFVQTREACRIKCVRITNRHVSC